LLGGTFEKDEWSLSVNEAAKARVLQGHAKLFDGFRRCQRAALVPADRESCSANRLTGEAS